MYLPPAVLYMSHPVLEKRKYIKNLRAQQPLPISYIYIHTFALVWKRRVPRFGAFSHPHRSMFTPQEVWPAMSQPQTPSITLCPPFLSPLYASSLQVCPSLLPYFRAAFLPPMCPSFVPPSHPYFPSVSPSFLPWTYPPFLPSFP